MDNSIQTIKELYLLKTILEQSNVPQILVTNPHTLCLNNTQNLCDQISSRRRDQLIDPSKVFQINNVKIILSETRPIIGMIPTTHRSIIDMNRNNSQNTLHFQIYKILLSEYRNIIVLDVHSFPRNNENWGGKTNNETDLVILYPNNYQQYANNLKEHLNKFNVVIIEGGENTLINYATQEKHIALLLEFPDEQEEERAIDLISNILDYFKIH